MYVNISLIYNMKSCRKIKKKNSFSRIVFNLPTTCYTIPQHTRPLKSVERSRTYKYVILYCTLEIDIGSRPRSGGIPVKAVAGSYVVRQRVFRGE